MSVTTAWGKSFISYCESKRVSPAPNRPPIGWTILNLHVIGSAGANQQDVYIIYTHIRASQQDYESYYGDALSYEYSFEHVYVAW